MRRLPLFEKRHLGVCVAWLLPLLTGLLQWMLWEAINPPEARRAIGLRQPGGRRPLTAALLVLVCLGLFPVGCGNPGGPELRIGINAWPGYELIYLAQERGFFRDAGVRVKLVEFGSLSDARRAYESSKIDGLATTIVEVLMARDATPRDLRIVRLIDFSDGADVIIAGKDTQSLRDLRGKRIGVELASLGIFVLARALELEGLSLEDVRPLSKGQQTMREALLAGELDATVAYPPESEATLRDPRFHIVFSTRKIPGEVLDVLAIDGDVLRQRPGQITAFLHAMDRAHEFLQQHADEACRIMGERQGLSGPEFKRLLYDGIRLVAPGEQSVYFGETGKLRAVIAGTARTLRDVKLISARPEVMDCLRQP